MVSNENLIFKIDIYDVLLFEVHPGKRIILNEPAENTI